MSLKFKIDSLEGIEEALHPFYKAVDSGGFVLDAIDPETSDLRKKVHEFRNKNIELMKVSEGHKPILDLLDGMDADGVTSLLGSADEVTKLREQIETGGGDGTPDAAAVEEIVLKRVAKMEAAHRREVAALTEARDGLQGERDTFHGQVQRTQVESAIQEAISKTAKVKGTALQDVLQRAGATWGLNDDGGLIAREHGESLFGADGNPLTPDEWVRDLVSNAPHLFEQAEGGGSKGGGEGRTPGGTRVVTNFGDNLADIAAGKAIPAE